MLYKHIKAAVFVTPLYLFYAFIVIFLWLICDFWKIFTTFAPSQVKNIESSSPEPIQPFPNPLFYRINCK